MSVERSGLGSELVCQGCGAGCGALWHLPSNNLMVCGKCYEWSVNAEDDVMEAEGMAQEVDHDDRE